jgi:hypothetical protein
MSKRHRISVLAISIVISLAGGLLINRFVTAQSAQAVQTAQGAEEQRWEYCAITDIGYNSNGGANPYYRVTVIYSSAPQSRVEMRIPHSEDPLLSSMSKLGADGWQMVGQAARDFGGHSSNHLYFKRRVKK